MPVDNLKHIDIASIDKNENAVLTISDHLEWDEDNEHLLILQNKINLYLEVIENGSLYEGYPDAKNRNIIINILAKYSPDGVGYFFLEKAKNIIEADGYEFSFSVIKS